ncbi:MAG: hypothetical protein PQJ60_07345 [Spirochaetales bacterium]|nr:hypothetical protein [Spirochaetales bacterium]
MKLKPEIQKELRTAQDKQLKRILKLLSGSDKRALNGFLQSGQNPGSKAFKQLKPNVQRCVLKLNLTSIEIMKKGAKNPFTRFRLGLAKLSNESMLKAIA